MKTANIILFTIVIILIGLAIYYRYKDSEENLIQTYEIPVITKDGIEATVQINYTTESNTNLSEQYIKRELTRKTNQEIIKYNYDEIIAEDSTILKNIRININHDILNIVSDFKITSCKLILIISNYENN